MIQASKERLVTAKTLVQLQVDPPGEKSVALSNKKSCLLKEERNTPPRGITFTRENGINSWKRLSMKDQSTLDVENSQPHKLLTVDKASLGNCTASTTRKTSPTHPHSLRDITPEEKGWACHRAEEPRPTEPMAVLVLHPMVFNTS